MAATDSDTKEGGQVVNPGWRRVRFEEQPLAPFGDPAGRLVIGFLTCVLPYPFLGGAGMGRVMIWLLLTSFFGLMMVVSAIWQLRKNALFQQQMERAIAEWDLLSLDAYRAERDGLSLSLLLRDRGYDDYFLRRWLQGLLHEQELSDEWRRDAEERCPPSVDEPTEPQRQESTRQTGPDEKTWRSLRDRERPFGLISDPKLRIAAGVVVIIGSVAMGWRAAVDDGWWPRFPTGESVAVVSGVLGLWLVCSGLRQMRRDGRIRAELVRARTEWHRLETAAVTARERGESFARELQERGYREYFVRRWVHARLQRDPVD